MRLALISVVTCFASAIQVPAFNAFNQQIGIFESCESTTGDDLIFENLVIAPYPIRGGQPVTVSVQATLNQDVLAGATANVVAKLAFITVLKETYDLCEKAKEIGRQCPIVTGSYNETITQNVDPIPVGGTASVTVDVKNSDGGRITCLKGKVTIQK
jgi:hypothetical protein